MLRRRTFREFAFCVIVAPLMVLFGLSLHDSVGLYVARTTGSTILDSAINVTILAIIVVGSGLAVLGALKVTEWVHMPAQRRHRVRPGPVLTAAWSIALAETAILITFVLLLFTRG